MEIIYFPRLEIDQLPCESGNWINLWYWKLHCRTGVSKLIYLYYIHFHSELVPLVDPPPIVKDIYTNNPIKLNVVRLPSNRTFSSKNYVVESQNFIGSANSKFWTLPHQGLLTNDKHVWNNFRTLLTMSAKITTILLKFYASSNHSFSIKLHNQKYPFIYYKMTVYSY